MTETKIARKRKKAEEFEEKMSSLKAPLATSLGALNLILLGGMGEVGEEQKRFLEAARNNLQNLFCEIQKFQDWLKEEGGSNP
ncbi:MAG: hypothetical protein HY714_02295 [Candidatus Omnitrophica bacterium]|nr:hypothetical protein [Candidatus Omnitrophota bacterium]